MAIPKTYHDGNPEDRAYGADLWSWLRQQPQDAWLLWARTANWDNAVPIFEAMLEDPTCDRSIVSWLFWASDPGYLVSNPAAFSPDSLVGKILRNVARGHYRQAELGYDRYEVVHWAQGYIAALKTSGVAPPFALPRNLCGPFEGRTARLPDRFQPEVERDLAEIFRVMNGRLPRSEQEHQRGQAGNLWIKKVFRLPKASKRSGIGGGDDVQFLESIFGRHSDYQSARRGYVPAQPSRSPKPAAVLSPSEKLAMKLLAGFAILGLPLALIGHWLETGSW